MARTRRSTRQTTSIVPKYTVDDSSSAAEEAPERNGKTVTGRKRLRDSDEDEEHVGDGGPMPPKKATKLELNPSKSATTKSKPTKTAPPAAPSSDSNRDANGEQEVFWLLKAEPLPRYENGINVAFSIDDLAACTVPEPWSGVRNPQARNNMQSMRKGDLGFFYHSNAKPSGVVGILRVVDEAKVDDSAFDAKDPYFDPKSVIDKPKWYCVGVEFVKKFHHVVDLHKIKGYAQNGGPLEGMQLVTNSRLSVSRVRKEEWKFILGLAGDEKGYELEKTSKE
ncbi:PUA-like domain-containing protein [Pyrenochaeta sp. MPI-SDFR-AT-0127]|nr:PUA-like domain-containing protein [Pyrenochaeta sp. MPI-SDFR-AT-0127]